VALSRTAEVVRDYVKKGTQLFIEGKIQTRSWDDKSTGEKKYRTEILIDELTLLGGRSGGENGSSSYGSGKAYSRDNAGGFGQSRSATSNEYTDQGITDDDIPF
jgi:single-strand DNA-binding protein